MRKKKLLEKSSIETAESRVKIAEQKLRDVDENVPCSTHITDVVNFDIVRIISLMSGDISIADAYFIGSMVTKMMYVLEPIERAHLSNLLRPLFDKLRKEIY